MKTHKLLLTLLFSAFSLTGFADNLTGTYQCTGHDPVLHKNYKVTTTISEKNNVYHVTWVTNDGRKFQGVGLLATNVLALMYQQTSKPTEVNGMGMQVYQMEGKKLLGKWLFENNELVGTEVCNKVNANQ